MTTILILFAIFFSVYILACIMIDNNTSPVLLILSGSALLITIIIGTYLHSHKCKYKSNVIDRYEQLTSEKTACKKPIINENHIAKNNEVVFKIVEVNNKYVAKLTFHDTMHMNRFFDYKHKCSVKKCASNYRKHVQSYLNQYDVKKLEITWPSGSYTKESTSSIKLPEISVH